MIVVYVKHYLNSEGTEYFDSTWYPYVFDRIRKQEGFVSLETTKQASESECRNITVKFKDQKTLDAWVEHDDHQAVINDLDKFRTRPWYYLHMEGDNPIPPADVKDWNEVPLER